MNEETTRRIHRVSALVTFAGIVFFLFFEINKGGPFRDINPFGTDPYDAVGSFAVQAALLIGILTYARALRLRGSPAQAPKTRLILRGNILILLAILVTLLADAAAVVVRHLPSSFWASVLLAELALMFILASLCAIALFAVFARVRTVTPPPDLTPADGIDDLWTLVRVPVAKAGAFLPLAFVEWVNRFTSDWLFTRTGWVNPRTHPWRFAFALGLLAGVGLLLAQLQEGLPPSVGIGLLVAGIFVSAELAATLVALAVLGGYLGLRPSFHKRR